jgi:eukaryotic-like serine/threonine-protein kinase
MSDGAQASTQRSQVGRYRIERLIARGGMGSVYLARHMDLHRSVALKVLTPGPELDDDGRFEDRFRLEAETLASLKHDNIVTLFDYEKTPDGRYYLALEYIDGPRYTDLLRQGPMEPDHVVRLILQVLRALRYSHKKGVVHRDLKPSNLLIEIDDEGEERVKVVDFGLVKVMEDDQSLTRAGLILGSPHCMSPEQIRGDEIDHRTDIYAIGVLLFRSLTGQWPFHGDTSTATMIAHINNPIPRFISVAPDVAVPPALESVVRRCLAKSPDRRPADAPSLMQELKVAMGDTAQTTLTDVSQPSEPHTLGEAEATRAIDITQTRSVPQSPVRPFVIGAVVALVLGGIVFAAWSAGRQGAQLPFPGAEPPAPSAEALRSAVEPAGDPAAAPAAPPPAAVVAPGTAPDAAPGTDAPAAELAAAPASKKPAAKKPAAKKPQTKKPAPAADPAADGEEPPADGEDKADAPDGYMGLPGDF